MKERYRKFTVRVKNQKMDEGYHILVHKEYVTRGDLTRKKGVLDLYKQYMVGLK